jgi:stage II sporulation protein D
MRIKSWYGAGLLIWVLAVSVTACKSPQEKPFALPQKQVIQGNEPDILVYMHDTNEKKSMKMEDYIAGVVAGEMKNDWPVAALAAQAILARTFTVEAIESHGGVPARGAQASTDVREFQAYDGKAVNDNVRKAVAMTRGMIVTYQGKPIHAWFHSSAGGITATAKEGLDYQGAEPAYIESVQSPDDLAPADIQNWKAAFSKKAVMAAMAKQGKNVSSIDSLEIAKKGPSGRTMVFTVNHNVEVTGPELRIALGAEKLKSMLLDKVEVSGEHVVFYGKGFGHGVGMSQWGAKKLAIMGKSPEEIIGYYFKNVEIQKRWQ